MSQEWWRGKQFKHPDTNNKVLFKSLPLKTQQQLERQHKKEQKKKQEKKRHVEEGRSRTDNPLTWAKKSLGDVGKLPKHAKVFIGGPKDKRKKVCDAAKGVLARKIDTCISIIKDRVADWKEAAVGAANFFKRKPLTDRQKQGLRNVAINTAINVGFATCLMGTGGIIGLAGFKPGIVTGIGKMAATVAKYSFMDLSSGPAIKSVLMAGKDDPEKALKKFVFMISNKMLDTLGELNDDKLMKVIKSKPDKAIMQRMLHYAKVDQSRRVTQIASRII